MENSDELKASYFQQSDQINELTTALSKAQTLIEPPKKNRTVKVSGVTKAGKPFEYSFKYADLEECKRVSQKPLGENGLSFSSQNISWKQEPWLWSRLFHSSGQWIGSLYQLPMTDEPKELAAEITYGRRYQYCELVDISAEDDNDAPPPRMEVTDADSKKQNQNQSNSSKPPIKNHAPGANNPPDPQRGEGPQDTAFNFDPASPPLQRIMALKKHFGLADKDIQETIVRETGRGSSKDCSETELNLVFQNLLKRCQ